MRDVSMSGYHETRKMSLRSALNVKVLIGINLGKINKVRRFKNKACL